MLSNKSCSSISISLTGIFSYVFTFYKLSLGLSLEGENIWHKFPNLLSMHGSNSIVNLSYSWSSLANSEQAKTSSDFNRIFSPIVNKLWLFCKSF